jgi:uncharacterized surface protein with fasciclin (FAS1) repeats
MRKLFSVLALLVVVAVMALPAFAQDQQPTLAEVLANDPDGRFTTLLAAVEAAGLGDAVAGLDGATILAPTNDAFVASLEALGLTAEDVLGNTDLLTQILTYHILPDRYFFRNLTSGPAITTLQGEDVQFDLTDGVFTVNGVGVSDIDNVAANGIVQVIDGVLLPPSVAAALSQPAPQVQPTAPPTGVAEAKPSLADVLANDADGRFTTLLAAVGAAGLGDAVAGLDGATILAPTNDAFTASLETLGLSPADVLANPDLLTQILTYHILPGEYFFRNLTSGPAITTLQGEDVQFDLTDGVFTVNGVNISDIDNVAANGIVQVIDGVLVPPSVMAMITPQVGETPAPEATETTTEANARPSIVEWLTNDADGRFTTLLAAVEAAGITPAVVGLDGATLLAPTNDAFAAAFDFLGVTAEDVLANQALLGQVLRAHIIPGEYFFRNLTSGPSLGTLAGSNVQFNLTDGVFTVNNVGISDVDNVASNGIIHVIDGVILPRAAASAFPANVRVAHVAADAPNVDVYVNFQPVLTDVPFNAISDFLTLPAGVYNIAVAPTGTSIGDAVIGPVDVPLAPNTWTTIAATGTIANGTLGAQVIPEDYSPLADGRARLTVFHAIEGAPAVNIVANGAVLVTNLAYPGTNGDNDGVFTLPVQAGTYAVTVTTLDGQTTLLDLGEVTLEAGMHYFVAATGTLDNPGVTLAAAEVPAQ